ncbi:MAG: helix-hairpin-helix domain-containing protein [Geobacter sp.]|nr:helix-hairpin-helix domain-containing protein [Geobacter sp.]
MGALEEKLRQLKGVGDVLARRLVENGLDTYEKIVVAGEEGLRAVKGLNPRSVSAILAQATALSEKLSADKAERIAGLKQHVATLRETVQTCAASAKERFSEALKGKPGQKLTRTLVQTLDTLDKVEVKLHKRVKKAGKGLTKASRRMEKIVEADLDGVRKGLKKTRKALKRVLA